MKLLNDKKIVHCCSLIMCITTFFICCMERSAINQKPVLHLQSLAPEESNSPTLVAWKQTRQRRLLKIYEYIDQNDNAMLRAALFNTEPLENTQKNPNQNK